MSNEAEDKKKNGDRPHTYPQHVPTTPDPPPPREPNPIPKQ